MTEEQLEEWLAELEEGFLEELKEERKIDPHIKVPTKAQQKKIIKLTHANHPQAQSDDLWELFEEAWEQVQKEAKIAARKRAAKEAAKLGKPKPEPKKKDPHKNRTMGWRKAFLKVPEGSEGLSHHGALQPYFKTPTSDQVLRVLQALDREKPRWDSKIQQSDKHSNKALEEFANKFAQIFPEMAKQGNAPKPKGSGCLILLAPLFGGIYFVFSHLGESL